MKKFILRLLAFIEDTKFYQVKSENKTYWITREEWVRNQRIIPFATPMICRMEKKESVYGK